LPLKTILLRQRQTIIAMTGGDNHVMKASIAKGSDDRFAHPAAALDHHPGGGIELIAVNQAFYRDVVSIQPGQLTVIVDDGVDRLNHFCRRIDSVKKWHTALFKRHGYGAAADA
jgi:hypothetical protein